MATESTGGTFRHFSRLWAPEPLGAVAAVAVGVWLTAPAWGPNLPAGDDVVPHVVRAEHAFAEVFGRGHLDGWFPRFMVGHQEFLFYGPGFTWLIGALRGMSIGAISTAGAVKVAGIVTLIAFAPAAGFLARSLGASRLASAITSVLALAVNNPFGVGPHAVYVIGLVPHQFAAVLFCLGIAASVRTIHDKRRRWVALAAISFALVVVTHAITAAIAAVFVALLVPGAAGIGPRVNGWWKRLAAIGAGSAGLSAFWLGPLLAHRDLGGPVTTWATPTLLDRLRDIEAGSILFSRGLAWAAGVSIATVIVGSLWQRRLALTMLAAAPIAYLLFAHGIHALYPGNSIALQLANRGLGYAGTFAVASVGIVMAAIANRFQGRTTEIVAIVVAVVIAIANAASARSVVGEAPPPVAALQRAALELDERVAPGARFATERDFPDEIDRTGISHPDLWLAWQSRRDTLNLFNVESSPSEAGFVAEAIGREAGETIARQLSRYGVSHVVTVTESTATILNGTPKYSRVWSQDGIAIFELASGPVSSWWLSGNSRLEVVPRRVKPEFMAATVVSARAQRVSAAVSWSPKWRAAIDGKPVPTQPTEDGLVSFDVPAGPSDVDLRYTRDGWDRAGLWVSIVTAGALGLSVSGRRRRPR